MSKHLIKGFITYREVPWLDKPDIDFVTYDPRKIESSSTYPRSVVAEMSFEVEVPDNFDPRPQQVAALEALKQKVRAEFAARVKEIEDQIASLLCIENAA